MSAEAGNQNDDVAAATDLEKADITLGKKIAKHRHHPVAKAAGKAGKLGDQGPLYALSSGLLAVGVVSRDRRLSDTGLAMLAAIGAADLTKRIAKKLVRRTRPKALLDDGNYEAEPGGSDRKKEQSFLPVTLPALWPPPALSPATCPKPAPPPEQPPLRSVSAASPKANTGRSMFSLVRLSVLPPKLFRPCFSIRRGDNPRFGRDSAPPSKSLIR